MFWAMVLGHLLGDYVLQTDGLAQWKSRSIWGTAVHGGVVTVCAWLCSLPYDASWWPYALLIGGLHTAIDIGRAKAGRTCARVTLTLFVLDQVLHVLVMVWAVWWSGWLVARPAESALGACCRAGGGWRTSSVTLCSASRRGYWCTLR